jgi:CubicO group peptidase (beta-lactamase class C family)
MEIHTSLEGKNFEQIVLDAITDNQPVADSGVAVAVVKNDKLCFAGGFGLRDRDAVKSVDADTLFAIGSATKAFTSMVLSIYASTHPISLDDSITNYAPDFKMQDDATSTVMTLVDILSHRTGLPRHDALWYLGPFTRSQLFYRLPYLAQISGTFRTKFLYNNLMYMTAGHVLECMAGQTWEQLVQGYILDPLDMDDTGFTLARLVGSPNYAKGYKQLDDVPLKDYDIIGPAAEINSNVLDLAKWVELFLAKGVAPNGTRLIDETSLERMYTALADVGNGATHYGLGWYVAQLEGRKYAFHDGVADGYTSYVSFMPDEKLGVIVLTNQHGTGTLADMWPRKVAERVYGYLLTGKLANAISLPEFPETEHTIGTPTASAPTAVASPVEFAPEHYTGMFCDPGYGDMSVSPWGGGLKISYYGGSWPLQPSGGDHFFFLVHAFATVFPVQATFNRDLGGNVSSLGLLLQRGVAPVVFNKR